MTFRIPAYRKKTVKSSNGKTKSYAVVWHDGRDKILGKHGSKESKQAYRRLLAEIQADRTQDGKPEISVLEVAVDYATSAKAYYRKNGRPTTEWTVVQLALKMLNEVYGDTPAAEFGPRRFKVVRQTMMDRGLSRTTVNHYCVHIIRAFRQAASDEKIPGSGFQPIQAVERLRAGRTKAAEPRKIAPVSQEIFEAILEHVPTIVRAMMKLQSLTGMRPGEKRAYIATAPLPDER